MEAKVRKIQEDDLELIMKWRMSPEITRFMNTDPVLTLESQKRWFQRMSLDDTVKYWMIIVGGQPAGIINLAEIDWEKKESSWGYYVGEKKLRSLELVLSLELSLYEYFFEVMKFETLHCETFSLNEQVIKLHSSCGSEIDWVERDEISKNGEMFDVTHMSIGKERWMQLKTSKKYRSINFSVDFCIHHIGYAVEDLEKSRLAFRQLGYMAIGEAVADDKRNVVIQFMRHANNTMIELVQPINEASPVYQQCMKSNGVASPYHICYAVLNIEKEVQELKRAGFIQIDEASPAKAIEGRNVTFMVNKDTGIVELVEDEESDNE